MAALLVVAIRFNPAMFAETKHIVATSPWIQDKIMPFVVNRSMIWREDYMGERYETVKKSTEGRLHNAIWSRNPERIRQLLAWGADTRATEGIRGFTPLLRAAELRDMPMEMILLLAEADPESVCIKCYGGRTALHYIMELYRGNFCPEKARLLIEAAPESIRVPNNQGITPAALVPVMRRSVELTPEFLALFGISDT